MQGKHLTIKIKLSLAIMVRGVFCYNVLEGEYGDYEEYEYGFLE